MPQDLPYEDALGVIEDARRRGGWQPIETLPTGFHVLLFWKSGERANGGIECANVYTFGDDWAYWTHGGPNSGSDWVTEDDEKPTHWMPLPNDPS